MNIWIKAGIIIALIAAVGAALVLKPAPQAPSPVEGVSSPPTQPAAPIKPVTANGVPQLLDFGAET